MNTNFPPIPLRINKPTNLQKIGGSNEINNATSTNEQLKKYIVSPCVLFTKLLIPLKYLTSLPELCGGVAQVLPLQEEVYLTEGGPVRIPPPPTLHHDVIDIFVSGRPRQVLELSIVAVQSCQVFHHLWVGETVIWLPSTQGQYLPQGHGEGPDVGFRGISAMKIKYIK